MVSSVSGVSDVAGSKIPQLRPNSDGTESWYVYDELKRIGGAVATVHGVMPDRAKPPERWSEVPLKAYVAAERVKAMDEDGVDVHTFFGNVAGVAGNTFSDSRFDEGFRLEAIQAFNDYQIEEYADPFPGRFITLAIAPLWDVNRAIGEVQNSRSARLIPIPYSDPLIWRPTLPRLADSRIAPKPRPARGS